MARCWVSAHDEVKEDKGIVTNTLKTTRCTAEQVRRRLWEGNEGEWLRKQGWNCDVRNLGVGGEMCINGAMRDLCAGMDKMEEGFRESGLLNFGVGVGLSV
jgi:hypothetical protein